MLCVAMLHNELLYVGNLAPVFSCECYECSLLKQAPAVLGLRADSQVPIDEDFYCLRLTAFATEQVCGGRIKPLPMLTRETSDAAVDCLQCKLNFSSHC